MNIFIVSYLLFGATFGVLTSAHQHYFSEGSTRRDKQGNRVLWAMICSFLWPLMALTGLYSWWRLAVRAKRAR